jgi:type II secretory pathway component PulK
VLLAVLVVIVILSLSAYRYSDMMSAAYKSADTDLRASQAKAFADSGIQYAAAILSNPDSVTNFLQGNLYDNPGSFRGLVIQANDVPRWQGRFSLVGYPDDPNNAGSTAFRFGVTDESSRINIISLLKADSNSGGGGGGQGGSAGASSTTTSTAGTTVANGMPTSYNVLMLLPNMTDAQANALLDWIDADDNPRSTGAEDDSYSGMSPAYQAKNGNPDSVEEFLLVQGMTPSLLYGNDLNRNGSLDPGEDDGTGQWNPGLAGYLTIYTREQNVDPQGNPRINLNQSDLNNLQTQLTTAFTNAGVDGTALISYIINYRQYGLTPKNNNSGGGGQGGGGAGQQGGGAGQAPQGAAVGGGGVAGGITLNLNQAQGGQGQGGSQQGQGGSQQGQGSGQSGGGNNQIASIYDLIGSSVTIPANAGGSGSGGNANAGGGGNNMAGGGGNNNAGGGGGNNNAGGGGVGAAPAAGNSGGNTPSPAGGAKAGQVIQSPLNDAGTLAELLPVLLNEAATKNGDIPGRVNVNTASEAVLTALTAVPNGLTTDNVQSILGMRPALASLTTTDPTFSTPAWLITQNILTSQQMKAMEPYLTTYTQVYRVQSIGYFDAGPTYARVEAVIDTNLGQPRILYWRDISTLGKGFDLSQGQ